MKPYPYVEPTSIPGVLRVLAEHGDGAHLMAGGTALVLLLAQGFVDAEVVVGLRPRGELADLARIVPEADGGLRLGALTTIRALERDAHVRVVAPALAQAAARVASPRIRNQATLGGLLAHADPAADLPPVLLALDAVVELAGPTGRRRVPLIELALDVFETTIAPDELLVAVHLPPPRPATRVVSMAFRPRTAEDYATVSVAVRVDGDGRGGVADARIALGSVAGTAVRARDAEAALVAGGATVEPLAVAALVDQAIAPDDDARGSAAYKRDMARVWTARAVAEALGGEAAA